METVDRWRVPVMVTLTVDQVGTLPGCRGFGDPEAAYEYVRGRRLIPKLMAALGSRVWVCVMETQANGWPHWHVVMDTRDGFVDFQRLHKWWRDTWGVGLGHVSSVRFVGAEHALLYITKYVVKPPRDGWPQWILNRKHKGTAGAVRWVSCSRSLGPLVRDVWRSGAFGPRRMSVEERSYAEDLSRCGSWSEVWERNERGYRWVASLPVSPGSVWAFVPRGVWRACGLAVDVAAVAGERGAVFWQVQGVARYGASSWRALARWLERAQVPRFAPLAGVVSGFWCEPSAVGGGPAPAGSSQVSVPARVGGGDNLGRTPGCAGQEATLDGWPAREELTAEGLQQV